MVWDPDCAFYCISLQYYCAGYCIHLLTGSCINKITNKTNLSKTSYLQIIDGQNVLDSVEIEPGNYSGQFS